MKIHIAAQVMAWSVFLSSPILGATSVTTYYVSTSGSDSAAGSLAAPFATLQKAVTAAKAGDTVVVQDGTYAPTSSQYTCGTVCSQNGYTALAQFNASGTASAPITITAQNKWGAILDCGLPSGYSGDGTDGVKACDAAFNFNGSASYITIKNFDITRAYWVGAMVNGNNSHITFSGNHFHHIGNRVYIIPAGASSNGIVGVFAGTGSSNVVWDGNVFNNIGRLPQSGIVNDDYSHDHGLYIYNGPYTITNNIFYSQAAGWDVQTSPTSHDMTIENNTMIGGANPQKDGCMILWGENTNILIQNNIFYNGRHYAIDNYQLSPTNVVIDHNIVFGSASGLISVGGVTNTNNRLNTDPKFTSASTQDYHLLAGSPAIDTGVTETFTTDFDGNARPQGAAFDIGAYEFGAAASPSACDINGDSSVNVQDVQLESLMALNVSRCTADLNADSTCNIIDVQRVSNAALGRQCVTGP